MIIDIFPLAIISLIVLGLFDSAPLLELLLRLLNGYLLLSQCSPFLDLF